MERRLDLEYRLLGNHLDQIVKHRPRKPNWREVQLLLQIGTGKSGKTSSYRKCVVMGLDPDGYNLIRKGEDKQ